MNPGEESKHQIFNVNISDVGSVDSRSTVPRRPRSSSQPTENNERIIKEPFLSPRRKLDKRVETMSSCSNTKPKPVYSECWGSVDGSLKLKRAKAKKIGSKYPNLLKQAKRNRKKKRVYKIQNVDEIINELNSITSPALYWDLLYKTLKEKNKSLLRSVVDEIGMPDCTALLREVSLIQDNGKQIRLIL